MDAFKFIVCIAGVVIALLILHVIMPYVVVILILCGVYYIVSQWLGH